MAKPPHLPKKRELESYFRRPSTIRLMIVVAFVVATTLILPRNTASRYDYEEGKTWQDEALVAPFDFPVLKSEGDYQQEVETAARNIPQVFLEQPRAIPQSKQALMGYFSDLRALQERWRQYQTTKNPNLKAQFEQMAQNLMPPIDPATLTRAFGAYTSLDPLERFSNLMLDSVYKRGYINLKSDEEISPLYSLRRNETQERLVDRDRVFSLARLEDFLTERTVGFKNDGNKLIVQGLLAHAQPNYVYNAALYENELKTVKEGIIRYKDKVRFGDTIIAYGQRITPALSQSIQSLGIEQLQSGGSGYHIDSFLKALGELMMVILLTIIVVLFLRLNRQRLYYNHRRLALLFSIYFFMTLLVVIIQLVGQYLKFNYELNFFYVAPLCMAPIIITIFFDDRVGYFSNIIIALLAGISSQNSFEFFFIQTCAGSVAVFNLSALRRRSQFYSASGILFLTYFVAYMGYSLYLKGSFAQINYANLGLFMINVLITLGSYPLVSLVEKIYGITSDITFVELLAGDHPLLKQLAQRAPGTYQHSLQVANIAEEVANRLGANGLVVHVGALFHDIGKLKNPEYFTENQKGRANPHDHLNPEESARIIIDHVNYGVELAREYKLPDEIVEFIYTHHGNSRVEYFFRKYQKLYAWEEGDNPEARFRYPGPLPGSKEQAILMFADSIEAASRSLEDPTPEQLENLIEKIVSSKINDNQLIDAAITFRDIAIIKRSILKILSSIYHHRIKYPDQLQPNVRR